MGWHVVRMGRRGTNVDYLWGSQKAKRSLGRPGRWWVDNIKMDLGEREWGVLSG
jgi:hypothetical protein